MKAAFSVCRSALNRRNSGWFATTAADVSEFALQSRDLQRSPIKKETLLAWLRADGSNMWAQYKSKVQSSAFVRMCSAEKFVAS